MLIQKNNFKCLIHFFRKRQNYYLFENLFWLTLVLLNQDLHCFSFSLWIYMNKHHRTIWLVDSQKWVWQTNLFSRIRVESSMMLQVVLPLVFSLFLTRILLNKLSLPHPFLIVNQSDNSLLFGHINSHTLWKTVWILIRWLLRRSHLIWIYTVFKGNAYPGSAGHGFSQRGGIQIPWTLWDRVSLPWMASISLLMPFK